MNDLNDFIKKWDDVYCAQHVYNLVNNITSLFLRNKINEISYLDIGANVGKVYDLLSKKIKINEAYFIEASPILFNYLKQKYSENKNLFLFNNAAFNKNDTIHFDQTSMLYQFQHNLKENLNLGLSRINYSENSVPVQAISLSNFLIENNLFDKLSFIKIDTESVDFLILEDILNVISKFINKPVIEFEVNYSNCNMTDNTAQLILDNYHSNGYHHLKISNCHGDGLLVPSSLI
jgi:FkbM family methyltransferase